MYRARALLLAFVVATFAQTVSAFDLSEYTWSQDGVKSDYLAEMAASKDGSKVLVVGYQQMFASTDYGVTWVDRNIPDTQDWTDVVATDDGSVFYGVESGDLYRSTDLGATWMLVNGTTFPNSYKLHIAADGKLLTYNYNDIYASTDGGVNWVTFTDVPGSWYYQTVEMSDDGQFMVAVGDSTLFTSSNAGATWTQQAGASVNPRWRTIFAMSADGSKMMGVSNNSSQSVYISTDYGVTWALESDVASVPTFNSPEVFSISDDGSSWIVGRYRGDYFTSTNGSTWSTESVTQRQGWDRIVTNPDLSRMISFGNYGNLYTSLDQGRTWTMRQFNQARAWSQLASSDDGQHLILGDYDRSLWTSADGGASWQERKPNGDYDWYGTAISGDGQTMVGTEYNGYIHTSTDAGVTWTQQNAAGQRAWNSVAVSDDGQTMAATARYGAGLYLSYDGGSTWVRRTITGESNLEPIAMSADGSTMIMADYGANKIYVSADEGVTWTEKYSGNGGWFLSVAISADGTKMATITDNTGGQIHLSSDGGNTWTQTLVGGGRDWSWITMSDDGQTLLAGTFDDYPFISTDGGGTWTEFTDYISTDTWWTSTVVSGDATRLFMTPYNQQVITGAVLGASTGGNTGGATGNAGGSTPPASASPTGTAGSGSLANTGLSQDFVIGAAGLFIVAAVLMIGRQLSLRR